MKKMGRLVKLKSLMKLREKYIFILIILCCIFIVKEDRVQVKYIVKQENADTYTSENYRIPDTEEYALYTIQSRRGPIYELPADDEKNVGVVNRRNPLGVYPKEAYLTFDDGPSKQNTMKILDILNQNGVKASFFIVGSAAEKNREIVEKLYKSGMCILPHSYSHEYSIYKDPAAYFEDLDKNIAVIESMTGSKVAPFIRMPGGSASTAAKRGNAVMIKSKLKGKGIRYVDWNVCSLDANRVTMDTNTIKTAVINSCRDLKFAVILMHDAPTKTTTVQALPEVIRYLKDNGFVFRTFEDITPEEERELTKRRIIDG